MAALAILVSLIVYTGNSQYSFMVEETNNRDVFLLVNTDIVGFQNKYSLMIIDKATAGTVARAKQYTASTYLSRQSTEDNKLQNRSRLYTSDSVEICITNRSKTLLLQDSPSKCQYEQQIYYPSATQHSPALVVLSRLSGKSNTTVSVDYQILTDFSFKPISLPSGAITKLISFLAQNQTYCNIRDNLLHCQNVSGTDFYDYQLKIMLENNALSLSLYDLLRDCWELSKCSFWVSPSKGSSISLGSVMLRRYSTKLTKNRTQFSEICYQNQPSQQIESDQSYYKLTTVFGLIIVIWFCLHRNRKEGQAIHCPNEVLF